MNKRKLPNYKNFTINGPQFPSPGLKILVPSVDDIKAVGGTQDEAFAELCDNVRILASTVIIEKGLTPRLITVTTTPQQIITGQFSRGYIFINPTPPVGLASSATILASANRLALATGNSQAAPLGVASYLNLAMFLDISGGGGGTVQIDAQTQDPLSLNWVTTQSDIFAAGNGGVTPSAVGTYYANVGNIGVDLSFAVAFTVGAGGSSTFSVSSVLKNGLAGGGSGLANTIFLGSTANVSQTSGYPLLEGHELKAFLGKNTEIWATSLIVGGISLMVFELK